MRDRHASGLCTGHRIGRSEEFEIVEVKCPRCDETVKVARHAVWFCACLPCGIIFDGKTGEVKLDREGETDDNDTD